VIGIDFSPALVEEARRLFPARRTMAWSIRANARISWLVGSERRASALLALAGGARGA